MSDIAVRIKQKREERGWTQTELARRCGFASRSTINKYEKGERDLSLDSAKKVASALGVDADWLIFGDDTENMKNEISRLFDMLPPEKQEAVLQFLRSMLGDKARA
jgi:transcriptional regulator with XRE-family HTH domain